MKLTGIRTTEKKALLKLACTCLLALILSAPSEANVSKEQATEQQLQTLKQNIVNLQKWLDDARDERKEAISELQKVELEVSQAAKSIRQVAEDIRRLKSQLETLHEQRSALQLASRQQSQILARQVRAAHSIGKQEYLKVLLNQEQPELVARTLQYYEYFNQARIDQLKIHKETLVQLKESERQISLESDALQTAKNKLEKNQADLKNSKVKREIIVIALENNIKHKGSELERLLTDRKQLEALLKAVEEAIGELQLPDASIPIAQLKGKLPWPTKGKIVRRFGSKDIASNTSWNGLIIRAPEGRDVTAIHHGHVVFADWLRGFGLLTIIDHGNGYMSLYGHNQALFKETGDWVNPNEVIASVGNSGGQKDSGLYFEIRRNGNPQNPQKWIHARK
jgi:septal ring factor EnvC (AmiA/AmiB activator)